MVAAIVDVSFKVWQPNQGTYGVFQGTFGFVQGTFGIVQGTFGIVQGTLGIMQGTCILLPSEPDTVRCLRR
jgi:hypothetical protein